MDNNSNLILNSIQTETFRKDGFIILPQFYGRLSEIALIQTSIYQIIGQVIKRHGVTIARRPLTNALTDFDDGFKELLAIDREYGSEVYDLVKQIPGFFSLIGDVRNQHLFTELRPLSIPSIASGGYGMRIDNPAELKFNSLWHQEYPTQLRSLNGLVFWTPLVDMTPPLGPVKIAVGSHAKGVLPIELRDPDKSGRTGAYSFSLCDQEKILSRYELIEPLLRVGDLLVMDFLLLHSSGLNNDLRSRWSIQFRYFDLDEPTGISHGWSGVSNSAAKFWEIHPEFKTGKYE